MSAFIPTFCPSPTCRSGFSHVPFRWCKDGFYPRLADGRRVQRFRCLACARRFSVQSFRLDFRQHKPHLNVPLLGHFISKVTHRQSARVLKIDRKTVHRRLRLFGPAMGELHQFFLARAVRQGGLRGMFGFDELETYEHNRRLKPVTVPVLIHRDTRFVVHLEAGQLPARGCLSEADKAKKLFYGPRPSESNAMVDRCFAVLSRVHRPSEYLQIVADGKRSYPPIIKKYFTHIAALAQVPSNDPRNTSNPMFQINHTFASLRDGVSRLVRRSWAASKKKEELVHHAWIWTGWKNYCRPVVNRMRHRSAAMLLGLAGRRLTEAELLRWRWPSRLPHSAFSSPSPLSPSGLLSI